MANPLTSRVNDALYKASLQLELFTGLEQHQQRSARSRTLMQSHRDAVFYHLLSAYRLFLLELASVQNHGVSALLSASELFALSDSAEAVRLLELEQTPNSFLAKIICEERSAWTLQSATQASSTDNINVISTVQINDETNELSDLIDALKRLVNDCRETYIEW